MTNNSRFFLGIVFANLYVFGVGRMVHDEQLQTLALGSMALGGLAAFLAWFDERHR